MMAVREKVAAEAPAGRLRCIIGYTGSVAGVSDRRWEVAAGAWTPVAAAAAGSSAPANPRPGAPKHHSRPSRTFGDYVCPLHTKPSRNTPVSTANLSSIS